MWLVVGLGNPGPEYEGNRHNLGWMIADEIHLRARGGTWRRKLGADLAEAMIGNERVLLCKPMEYMNVSGQAVARAAMFWRVPVDHVAVVHDDLDLPFGRLRLGTGGGHGGHNGLRSMISDLGSPDFSRVRVGVGRPAQGRDSADWVLSNFNAAERKGLPSVIAEAAEATENIVSQGLSAAMNKFNTKKTENT